MFNRKSVSKIKEAQLYYVLLNGEKRTIYLADILGCVDDMNSAGPDLCPMQTAAVLSSRGGSRKAKSKLRLTRKRK